MAIDVSARAEVADGASERRAEASSPASYACAECGYGIAVSGSLPSCPMCGGDAWQPESRLDGRRGTRFRV